MRQFASKGLRIWSLSTEAKLVYSAFCLLSLLGLLSSLLLYEDLVGPTLRGAHLDTVGAYYARVATSATAPPEPAAPLSHTGPHIALPEELSATAPGELHPAPPSPAGSRLTVQVPYRKLLEVTHFHLFTIPVFLLILTHLFLLTSLSTRAKRFWICSSFAAASLHMATPWIVRWLGRSLAFLHAASGLAFFLTSLLLCLLPVVQMWWRPKTGQSAAGGSRQPSLDTDEQSEPDTQRV